MKVTIEDWGLPGDIVIEQVAKSCKRTASDDRSSASCAPGADIGYRVTHKGKPVDWQDSRSFPGSSGRMIDKIIESMKR